MRLYLDKKEKKDLLSLGEITIKRNCYLYAPKSSIVHGVGNKSMFDKIAYCWVYGDTDDYIEKMKGEGIRGTEYISGKNGMCNIVNGGCWFEFNKIIDEFGPLKTDISNGRKNRIVFQIDDFTCNLLPQHGEKYLTIELTMKINLSPTS